MKQRVSDSATRGHEQRDAEADVLRALCTGECGAADRKAALARLADYDWQESEHRVVYNALARCSAKTGAAVRAELPAVATRMGFPDVEWNRYWGEETQQERGVESLNREIENLLKTRGAQEE
ncbi:MAG TPA: hypothetical protein VMJ93_09635 [Verrucomicrobiae bacterium]|nr:hypothetical protein [Verrucomicrobiae bacterium]